MSVLEEELRTAAALARQAGAAVMSLYGTAVAEDKAGSPVTAADRLANELIVAGLRERFPEDGILSEESRDTTQRLGRTRVWVVDPLDGTREYVDGVGEFAVMIGLAIHGQAVLGVVYCPAVDMLFTGVVGQGAWLERDGVRQSLRARPMPGSTPRLVGSRSHPDARLRRIQDALGAQAPLPAGSVGVKCGLVARGECDLYVHPVPYLKEWDTCAPEAVLRAAGGTVCDCVGEPLQYNKRNPVQPMGILAAAPGLLTGVLGVVRTAFETDATPVAAAT